MAENNSNNNNSYKDDKVRDFILDGKVEESTVKEIAQKIIEINRYDEQRKREDEDYKVKPINIIVNTYGGSVHDANFLVGVIETSKTPIHTYCFGKAMSAGFLIFVSGHKRFAYPLATFMYHDASIITNGTLKEIKDVVEVNEELIDRCDEYILSVTNLPKHLMDKAKEYKKNWYLTAEEAFHYGVVDELLNFRPRQKQ